jgi:multidrug efflux pump subunit AcrA (membrane-fusion protein)
MKYSGEKSYRKKGFLRKNIGRLVALLFLVVAGFLFFRYQDKLSAKIHKVLSTSEEDPVPVAKLAKQPFLLTVPSIGEIVGLATTPVATPNTSSGSLKIAWLKQEGSFVKAGEPVVRFDSTDAQLSLEKQQNTLDANQENTKITTWRQATDDKVLSIDRKDAEEEYRYDKTVMPQDETIFSKWDIITAQADIHYAEERIDFLKNKTKTQQRIARSDQQILAIERNKAQSEVSLIKRTLSSLELGSPVGGLVLYHRERREEPQIGNQSSPGQVVIEIVNLDVLQARIYVLERDGGNLEKGQPVVIKLDALPDKDYHGTIRTVSSVAGSLERNSPLRYFTCDVSIADAGKDLKHIRPGMSLRGDIVLQKYESCFVVPSGAVNYRELEKDSIVYIKKKDSFFPQTVKTGLSSHGEAIILEGVQEGDLVALADPKGGRKQYLPDFSKGAQSDQRGGPGGGPPPRGMMMMMGGGR